VAGKHGVVDPWIPAKVSKLQNRGVIGIPELQVRFGRDDFAHAGVPSVAVGFTEVIGLIR